MRVRAASFVAIAGLVVTGDALADDAPAPPSAAPGSAVVGAAPTLQSLLSAHSHPWIALQERNVFGGISSGNGTPTNDFGADALFGAWLARAHIQPIADVGWSRVFWEKQKYDVDTFRVGGKLACGGLAADDIWLGASVGLLLEAGWKHEAGLPLAWAATPSIGVLLQGRVSGPIFLALDSGLERALPNLKWQDGSSIYNGVRFQIGLQIGVVLGWGG